MSAGARADEYHRRDVPVLAPPFSVIVPACNEAAVIRRCIAAIQNGMPVAAELDLIIAVNGSSDGTAQIASEAAPDAQVIELPEPSKARAINQAFAHCRNPIRIVVDADVITSYRALAATACVLAEPGVMAASPAVRIDTSQSSGVVKAFYRVWQALPYVTDGLVGGGVYGLSATGTDRIGELPDVIADDLYVRTRFAIRERRSIAYDAAGEPVWTTFFPPTNAMDLIRTEARRLRGKQQVDRKFATGETGTINGAASLAKAWREGTRASDLLAYVAVKVIARLLSGWNRLVGRDAWSRDLSSRAAG